MPNGEPSSERTYADNLLTNKTVSFVRCFGYSQEAWYVSKRDDVPC